MDKMPFTIENPLFTNLEDMATYAIKYPTCQILLM